MGGKRLTPDCGEYWYSKGNMNVRAGLPRWHGITDEQRQMARDAHRLRYGNAPRKPRKGSRQAVVPPPAGAPPYLPPKEKR